MEKKLFFRYLTKFNVIMNFILINQEICNKTKATWWLLDRACKLEYFLGQLNSVIQRNFFEYKYISCMVSLRD